MESELVDALKKLFRQILVENIKYSLSSEFLFSCTKALYYLENVHSLNPKGSMKINSSYKKSDGHNEYGHSYYLTIKSNSAIITSRHYFKEAYGLHYESHEEELYPDSDFTFEEIRDNYLSWEEGFLKGLKNKFSYKENLTGLKVKVPDTKKTGTILL